jgi:uncharacterized membrane protein YbhN (UPF0104 family)
MRTWVARPAGQGHRWLTSAAAEQVGTVLTRGRSPELRRAPAWVRPVVGAAILGALLARFGTDSVIRGVDATDGPLLATAVVLTAVATACCAWRWRAVAAALGAGIGLRSAYLSCFGAQFLNATLPGGVLGDAHRAVEHGRRTDGPGSTGRAVRSVFWERTLGLAVQVVVTVAVVGLFSTGLRPAALTVAAGAVVVAVVLARWGRHDLIAILGRPAVAVTVVAASLGVAACHTAVLLAAMAATGVDLPTTQTVALALAMLLGSTVPTSIAGWGPREGAAAWAFAAVGLPAADGLAVSVAYGVAALVATLPGALALLLTRAAPPVRTEAPVG